MKKDIYYNGKIYIGIREDQIDTLIHDALRPSDAKFVKWHGSKYTFKDGQVVVRDKDYYLYRDETAAYPVTVGVDASIEEKTISKLLYTIEEMEACFNEGMLAQKWIHELPTPRIRFKELITKLSKL